MRAHRGVMDTAFHDWLRARGGVAHSRDARDAGFSPHRVARAVSAGVAERVRRSWLVLPGCPSDYRAAAMVGGRLTCISAAAQRGLWVPSAPETPHIAVPHSAAHFDRGELVLHWATPPVPLPRTAHLEHPLNVLFHVARCLPRGEALAVWESALRTRTVDAELLSRVHWRSSSAAALAGVADSLSDSGIETAFVALLRRCGLAVRQQVWVDGHPLDALIGEYLGVQIDGFAHHRAADRRRDLRADARLALRGYTVLRFDYQQVLFDSTYVADTVLTAVAQRLHLAPRAR